GSGGRKRNRLGERNGRLRAAVSFSRRRWRSRVRMQSLSLAPVDRGRLLVWLALVVGVALIVLALVYWAEPAKSRPPWIPGHEAGSNHHHIKHGIASFLVGVACLVFAWFRSAGPRPRRAAA